MSELNTLVEQGWEALNRSRDMMTFDGVPAELVNLTVQSEILSSFMLSRGAGNQQDLQKLAAIFSGSFDFSKSRKTRPYGIKTDIAFFIRSVRGWGAYLLLAYGVQAPEEALQPREFADTIDISPDGDGGKYELRWLPDHPNTKMVIKKLIEVDQIRRKHAYARDDFYTGLSPWIPPDFSDWRAAVEFTKYSHRWVNLKEDWKIPESSYHVCLKNRERYKRFGLTSFDKVRQVSPGALFQVENVFGDFAAQYVAGDLEKFRELLKYAGIRGARSFFSRYPKP